MTVCVLLAFKLGARWHRESILMFLDPELTLVDVYKTATSEIKDNYIFLKAFLLTSRDMCNTQDKRCYSKVEVAKSFAVHLGDALADIAGRDGDRGRCIFFNLTTVAGHRRGRTDPGARPRDEWGPLLRPVSGTCVYPAQKEDVTIAGLDCLTPAHRFVYDAKLPGSMETGLLTGAHGICYLCRERGCEPPDTVEGFSHTYPLCGNCATAKWKRPVWDSTSLTVDDRRKLDEERNVRRRRIKQKVHNAAAKRRRHRVMTDYKYRRKPTCPFINRQNFAAAMHALVAMLPTGSRKHTISDMINPFREAFITQTVIHTALNVPFGCKNTKSHEAPSYDSEMLKKYNAILKWVLYDRTHTGPESERLVLEAFQSLKQPQQRQVGVADEYFAVELDIACVYPVITMEDGVTHTPSKINLLGPDSMAEQTMNLTEHHSIEKYVERHFPPTFIFDSMDDSVVPAENTIRMVQALRGAKVRHELAIYEHGLHGQGLGEGSEVTNDGVLLNGHPWTARCLLSWLNWA